MTIREYYASPKQWFISTLNLLVTTFLLLYFVNPEPISFIIVSAMFYFSYPAYAFWMDTKIRPLLAVKMKEYEKKDGE